MSIMVNLHWSCWNACPQTEAHEAVPAELLFCIIMRYGSNSFLCHVQPWRHKQTETPLVSYAGSESPALCPAALLDPPASALSLPPPGDRYKEKAPRAQLKPHPAINRHSADTSPALAASLIPSQADVGQRLLAEVRRTVSVKWEQRFLRNRRLTNEGWWSSSRRSHYFWWAQAICKDGALFVWAATPSGQTHSKHTQTLHMMDAIGKISTL